MSMGRVAVITLLTDFGTADPYVAEVKGALLTRAPGVVLVDVTHEVPPGDVRAGAWVLGRSWRAFPEGTVHLAVVDPGVGTHRAALAVAAHGHFFVAPDNGILTGVLRAAAVEAVALPTPAGAAATFHGRDLFAPAAAALATGAALTALGEPLSRAPQRLALAEPRLDGERVVGEVAYVDRFGTLVTNLDRALLPPGAIAAVAGLEIGPLHRTFGDVASGALLAFVGSGGTLEIAVRDGSAAQRLGLGVGAVVWVRGG